MRTTSLSSSLLGAVILSLSKPEILFIFCHSAPCTSGSSTLLYSDTFESDFWSEELLCCGF